MSVVQKFIRKEMINILTKKNKIGIYIIVVIIGLNIIIPIIAYILGGSSLSEFITVIEGKLIIFELIIGFFIYSNIE